MPEIVKTLKVQAMGGAATPAPPLGAVLGQAGVDIAGFVSQFNERTQDRKGQVVPAVVTVYDDRSFKFELKQAPAASMIIEKAKLKKGSGEPNKNKIGKLTNKQLEEIAVTKMPDLNTTDVEMAKNIIAGTARSMGVTIEG